MIESNTIESNKYYGLTPSQISTLQSRGCSAESWEAVKVSKNFVEEQLFGARFEGYVFVGEGAKIINSTIKNYIIGDNARVESVHRLECRSKSCFGNGVEVAVINENGGRAIKIYDDLRAPLAYVWATYRHKVDFCSKISAMVDSYAISSESDLGVVGEGSIIVGAKFVREVRIGRGVAVEGASLLCNGTLCDGARVGVDVKAEDFVAVEGSIIDTGATLRRCFVGEGVIVANGFTAVDSVFFGNSHLENGEAASIFAGAYTVSHHKSSLLIAGMFSFFNAGSGSNQSNHLFKTGAVHQSIHPRGCKFASGAYIMAPAVEGAYTMVKGYHARHHDTKAFPFSYLIDDEDRSILMPGANLTSYGTERDIAKWGARDGRKLRREVINFEEHNPYITSQMVSAVDTIHTLMDQKPGADQYMWNRVVIKSSHLKRGLGLYNKAIASSLGEMLKCGDGTSPDPKYMGDGVWIDAAGQYITAQRVDQMIEDVELERITQLSQIDDIFREFGTQYNNYVYGYGYWLLGGLLGHYPSSEEIKNTIESSVASRESLDKMRQSDKNKDCDMSMAVGYGLHASSPQDVEVDYKVVRNL
ncbi:MAG: DUF4954 family protein [Rikenellaceae bacterium]